MSKKYKNQLINNNMEGFTLIELLAVIIILAVIALIATPVVLNVVDNAKESARKSSVSGYADTVKLSITEKMFENSGSMPTIDSTFLSSLTYQGETVACNEVKNSSNSGVILKECTVGSNTNLYCYAKGKVYNCDDTEFINIYNNIDSGGSTAYQDASGANQPVIFDNMIPVEYNGTNWVYADTSQEWYNYDNKEWANAVVLVASPSQTYNVGDTILMSDVSQMYVWIPRYKYTIFNGNNGSIPEQEINVTFESETSSTGTVSCTDAVSGSGSYSETCTDTTNGSVTDGTSTYTHPAFTFGSTELKGIWVGKFEIGNVTACTPDFGSIGTYCDLTTLGIQIKPNVISWRGARESTFFTAISNIASTYSIDADSHMIKNMEWGAVAYLEASQYGLGTTEIGINNNSDYTTGCGVAAGTEGSSCNTYDTTDGQLASTTGNIYGIYDMSGGAWEYDMGSVVYSDGSFFENESGFSTAPSDSKYYDLYTYDATSYVTHSRGKLGDATKETLVTYGNTYGGWYSNYAYFPKISYSWFVRGGYNLEGPSEGIFSFNGSTGASDPYTSTRAVLTES